MNPRSLSLCIAVALAGGAVAAQAVPLSDSASVELFVGGNAGIPGSFSDGPTHLVNTTAGDISYDRVHFDNAYDHRYTGGAEFDYAFSPNVSTYARASYAEFNGEKHEIGSLFGDNGKVPINAQFEDNTQRQLDLGARYTFSPESRFRPFVGLALGASDLSATRAMIDNPVEGGTTRVMLAKGGTVFEQRLETGVQFSPLDNFDIRLTAAASHLGGQKASDDPNLALLGVTPTHSTVGTRWDYPAELGAVWHF